MDTYDDFIDIIFDSISKIFYPEELFKLDKQFSKFELLVMMLLQRNYELSMGELSNSLNIPMSTLNGIIDRLVKKGYIIKQKAEEDKRIILASLTEEGKKLVQDMKNMISKYISIILKELTEEEKTVLLNIVMKIIDAISNAGEEFEIEESKIKVKSIEID